MTLSQIKTNFTDRLLPVYSKNETEAIFSFICRQLLNYSKIDIHAKKEIQVPEKIEIKIRGILTRLIDHEPIQYILGSVEFYNLNLNIDNRALIPRPETELLVDIIVKDFSENKNLKIIDLCTGSGCIAIALGAYMSDPKIIATDISIDALSLAQSNAHKVKIDVEFIPDSILKPKHKYGSFNLIVSNPPYVRESEMRLMEKNVIKYEPHQALFVKDSDPLVFYRAIAEFGQKYLYPDGSIYCEINESLGKETAEIFMNHGFRKTFVLKDLNNKNRFIKASKL
jgi:release factor glutamine methyltransferase